MVFSRICAALVLTANLASTGCFVHQKAKASLKNLNHEDLVFSLDDKSVINLKNTFEQHDATVLFWWATKCPCVVRYQSRMENLKKKYANRNIAMFAVSSNVDDSLEKVVKTKQQRSFGLPIILDREAKLASLLGVRTTPTSLVLDSDTRVRYKGWIDNERLLHEKGRVAYLEDALSDVINKSDVTQPKSPIYGCLITKSLLSSKKQSSGQEERTCHKQLNANQLYS